MHSLSFSFNLNLQNTVNLYSQLRTYILYTLHHLIHMALHYIHFHKHLFMSNHANRSCYQIIPIFEFFTYLIVIQIVLSRANDYLR